MELIISLIPLFISAGAILIGILILLSGYVKASPDEAILISGIKKIPRIITGRASIKIPFFERKDRLTLRLIKLDVKTRESVPTQEFINVNVDAVVTIKVSSDPKLIRLAAENFLNANEDTIAANATDVLEGNIREIVGTMSLEGMISNRQEFSKKVQENAVPDMEKMGLEIVSFNVQNFSDKNGIIEDLGIDNTTKIKKNAAIVKAESMRDIEIAQARADKEANDAKVASDQEIAVKQNELAIKRSELKLIEDTKKAIADAAYEIQKEEQRKTIEISTANANLAKQEKEIELKEREVTIAERTLEANIKKKAEAEKYAKQQAAEAELFVRQKQAEAAKYEEVQRAEALQAKATAERVAREQEAIGIKAVALAEAEGIEAKGVAEAIGIEKKALAMQQMQEAAVLEMYFAALPKIAENIASPLNNVDKITMYGDGNSAKLIGDITKSVTQITDGLTDSMGLDIKGMIAGFLGGKLAVDNNHIGDQK
jgi:flotillin